MIFPKIKKPWVRDGIKSVIIIIVFCFVFYIVDGMPALWLLDLTENLGSRILILPLFFYSLPFRFTVVLLIPYWFLLGVIIGFVIRELKKVIKRGRVI